MKNVRTCIALLMLCGLLLLTAASVLTVRHTCGNLLNAAENIANTLQTHPEDTRAAIQTLRQRWKSDAAVLHLFVPNQTLVDLNEAIARLDAMYTADCDELTAEIAAIRADLLWIRARK
ncbi:MAG TPA: hypothetical protein DDX71_03610 [Ruminococcus sp.]|nr:hypothetical protein [Ruminococcus sp.]